MYIYHIFFIHSSFDGQNSRFHILAIDNSAAVTIGCMFFPRSGIAGSYGISIWVSFRKPYCSPYWLYQLTFPPTVLEGSIFSTPSPAFNVCRHFDDGHSDQCEVIFHCSFDLHFSNNEPCWTSFHVFVSHLYVFFGEMSVRYFFNFLIGLFVFLVLNCMSCLYILEINLLSLVSFAIIFSHSEGSLFTLLIVSFAVKKLLSLMKSHLFMFIFYFCYSRRWVIEDLALIYVFKCFTYVFL